MHGAVSSCELMGHRSTKPIYIQSFQKHGGGMSQMCSFVDTDWSYVSDNLLHDVGIAEKGA